MSENKWDELEQACRQAYTGIAACANFRRLASDKNILKLLSEHYKQRDEYNEFRSKIQQITTQIVQTRIE